jgi:hypothetical protein
MPIHPFVVKTTKSTPVSMRAGFVIGQYAITRSRRSNSNSASAPDVCGDLAPLHVLTT